MPSRQFVQAAHKPANIHESGAPQRNDVLCGVLLGQADCFAALIALHQRRQVKQALPTLNNLALGPSLGPWDDYNASLRYYKTSAWSLYGLGIAQLRTGRPEDGQKNLQEAIQAQQIDCRGIQTHGY
jgi:hypothetical protein